MSTSSDLFAITDLKSWYQKEHLIIDIQELAIPKNKIVGLIGRNGAGKTTLINTLSSVKNQYSVSSVIWKDQTVLLDNIDFKKNRYTVFTENNGFMNWNFEKYSKLLSELYNENLDSCRMDYLLKGFHFDEYKHTLIKNLSTGNRKKVFLIAGLLIKRPLFILDEPFDGLDFESTEFLYEELIHYKKVGSVLLSSHIIESITRVCDEALVLKQGQITKIGLEQEVQLNKLVKKIMGDL